MAQEMENSLSPRDKQLTQSMPIISLWANRETKMLALNAGQITNSVFARSELQGQIWSEIR